MTTAAKNKTVHWLGAGLSSGPGIRRLATSGQSLVLWNRTLARAEEVFAGRAKPTTTQIRSLDQAALRNALSQGDVVVSMLPATMHPEIAALCLEKQTHLVTTSYVSESMRAFDAEAKKLGLSFVNECGLDPGLDHVFAHLLVSDFREKHGTDKDLTLEFRSYCGGFPKVANEFKYKFSWSPAGVLRALKNPARYIADQDTRTVSRVWEVVEPYTIGDESFEVYPNRDSVPYLEEYHFEKDWKIGAFVRGTIRLNGWTKAWAPIFEKLPTATNEQIEAMASQLWTQYAYQKNELDRVVLAVELRALRGTHEVYRKSFTIDEAGSGSDTAMAKLVSLPATFAVESVLRGEARHGVSGAPEDKKTIEAWLQQLGSFGLKVQCLSSKTN